MNISLTNQIIQHGICSYTAKRNHLNGNVALLIQTIRGNMLSNSIEKLYKCNQCEYATSKATNLIAHKKLTPEKRMSSATYATLCQYINSSEHFSDIHILFLINNAMCWLTLIDDDWCFLCWLMLFNSDWCWCWLIHIDAD